MRRGRVFRRCSQCGAKVDLKRCTCGSERFSWAYVVDVAPVGAPRQQRAKGGFRTKAATVEAMTRLQTEKADGTYVQPSRQTISTYLGQWLAARSAIRENTRRDYRVSITNHIGPRIGAVPLQILSRVQVKGLYQQLSESGLAEKTVHNVHICLRKALGDALEDGLIRQNPADRAHTKPKDGPEMMTWSGAELVAFLDFTAKDRDYAIYQLAATTGMRRGELLGLRWRDVDLNHDRLNIRQQWTRQGSKLAFCPPKSKRSFRTIDLDPDTAAMLRDQRQAQDFERRAWGPAYRSDLDLVFCRQDGTANDPDVINRRFGRRVRGARLPVIRMHDLRHTHATLLLADGVDVKTVSERLGHDSIQTTLELYGHVTPTMRANAASRFGTLLGDAQAVREHSVISQALTLGGAVT